MKINKVDKSLITLAVVITILFPIKAFADMTLQQGLDQTLTTNPEILADQAAVRSSEHAIGEAKAGYFPRVDVTATAGHEYIRNKYNANACATGVSCEKRKFRTNPSISLVQNVFDGLETPRNVAKANVQQLQAEMKLLETRELVSFRFISAASDVRRFQRLYRLAQDNIAAHERILSKVNKLIDGGRASVADRYTVSARLNDARSAAVDIQGDLNSAIARFKSVAGIEPGRLASTAIPDSYIPKTLAEAVTIGLERNRSIVLANASLEVAKADLKSVETAFYPKVSIEADASYAKNTGGRSGFTKNAQVLGVVRYNLFNGGGDISRTNRAAEAVAQARHRFETAQRNAEEEIRRSWAERESARLQARDLRKSVADKLQVRDAFIKQYDLGTRTLLDVLDSENDYFLTKGSLITVDVTQDVTEARLLASMGVLLEKYGYVDRSAELQAAVASLSYANDEKNSQKDWLQDTASVTKEQYESLANAPISNEERQSWAYDPVAPAGKEVYDFDSQQYVKSSETTSGWRNPNVPIDQANSTEQEFFEFNISANAQEKNLAYNSQAAAPLENTEEATKQNQHEKTWWEQLTAWSPSESVTKETPNNTNWANTTSEKANPKTQAQTKVEDIAYYDFDKKRSVKSSETSSQTSTRHAKLTSDKKEEIHDFYDDPPSWWTSLQKAD